jgi:hypothetical protein
MTISLIYSRATIFFFWLPTEKKLMIIDNQVHLRAAPVAFSPAARPDGGRPDFLVSWLSLSPHRPTPVDATPGPAGRSRGFPKPRRA